MNPARKWQKTDPGLRSHPAFIDLVEELGSTPLMVDGLLSGLWRMAFTEAKDGDISRFKPRVLARMLGWTRDPDKMLNALISSGFVTKDLQIHDWYEWGGASLTNTSRTKTGNEVATLDGFKEFWSVYPRHEARAKAELSWKRLNKNEKVLATGVAKIMATLVASGQKEKRFVLHATTFLNGRRWEDWRHGIPASWTVKADTGREHPPGPGKWISCIDGPSVWVPEGRDANECELERKEQEMAQLLATGVDKNGNPPAPEGKTWKRLYDIVTDRAAWELCDD